MCIFAKQHIKAQVDDLYSLSIQYNLDVQKPVATAQLNSILKSEYY
jgi:hypothetical protein